MTDDRRKKTGIFCYRALFCNKYAKKAILGINRDFTKQATDFAINPNSLCTAPFVSYFDTSEKQTFIILAFSVGRLDAVRADHGDYRFFT